MNQLNTLSEAAKTELEAFRNELARLKDISVSPKHYITDDFKLRLFSFVSLHNLAYSPCAKYVGLSSGSLTKWRKHLKKDKVSNSLQANFVAHGPRQKRYTIATKIEVVKSALAPNSNISYLAEQLGCSACSIHKWITDYKEGKFNLDNVTQITRKKIQTLEAVLEQIKSKKAELDSLKVTAKQLLEAEYQAKLREI